MRHMTIAALMGASLLTACATAPQPAADSLDAVARDYVALTLEIGEREPGYVDAYYGPAEWAEAAKANPRALPQLAEGAAALTRRLEALPERGLDDQRRQRRAYLSAHVSAASARLRMLAGEKMSFADEAEALFGVRPELRPLASYDPVLARIDALVPGEGPLAERVAAFRARYVIPKDRLEPVMRAAIAECKARTVRHMTLPANETFTLEFVTNKPWSGYNWYKGNATSLIQINTDLPVLMSRAVDLGCHEGYPGHHVLNMLLEQRLSQQRGWKEFTVYPLYSPMSLIAEGSANFGIELAFPGDEMQAFQRDVLYPLAGLDPALAALDTQLTQARSALSGARFTIARDYLDGRITRAEALRLAQHYQVLSPERAEQSIGFTDKYRSYVINYGLGMDLVREHVDAAGSTPQERWAAMERILSEPTLPADLLPAAERP